MFVGCTYVKGCATQVYGNGKQTMVQMNMDSEIRIFVY